MIVLTETTDYLKLRLGDTPATELPIVISYNITTSTTVDTFRAVNQSTGTTTLNLLPALTSGQKVSIYFISIHNPNPTNRVITVWLEAATLPYPIQYFTLEPYQTIVYSPENGWIKTDGDAGNSTMLELNTSPLSPITNYETLYSMQIAGRTSLFGANMGLIQQSLFTSNRVMIFPNTGSMLGMGTVISNLGTASIILPTVTNLYTATRRTNYASVVTTANQQVGTRTEVQFVRGNYAGLGGFFAMARVGFGKWLAGNRLFVGFTPYTTTMVTVQPSTLFNTFGFCIEAGDTAITLLHNNGAGTGVKETISSQPALANDQGYDMYIYCKPNDSVMYWRIDDVNLARVIAEGSITTELPVDTTLLCFQAVMSNGANVVAGDAVIGIGNIIIQ